MNGVATTFTGAWFVMDGRQRIVEWTNSAASAVGISREDALGRTCFEVTRGYDPFGRALCRPKCPAFKTLRRGHLTSRCALLLSIDGGPKRRFVADLVALPDVPGGTLAVLVEHGRRPTPPVGSTPDISTPGCFPDGGSETALDLLSLATLSASLSPDRLEQSIDKTLDWLRLRVGAESAELFLVEPRGGDMLLAAYKGPFRAAFTQTIRFRHGEGFPGLVLRSGKPVLTRNLPEDPRFLRTSVKEKGFRTYACVPLLASGRVVGVFGVADRRPDLDLERAARLLTWAARPLCAVLQAGLLQARESVVVAPGKLSNDGESDFDGFLRSVLHQMVVVGNAVGGALLFYDRNV